MHSRKEFIMTALRHEVAARECTTIDEAFAEIANDPAYQAETSKMTTAFATADWEALRLTQAE